MSYDIINMPASTATYSQGRSGKNIEYILIHYTGAAGSARNNGIYFSGGNRNASAHYFIDSYDIVLSVPESNTAWHAGNFDFNQRSLGIEVCSNGEDFTAEEIKRLTWLVGVLMQRYGLGASRVIRHYDAYDYGNKSQRWIDPHKMCPAPYAPNGSDPSGSKWRQLHATITGGKVEEPTSEGTGLVIDGLWGRATTEALQQYFGTPCDGEVWHQWPSQAQPAFKGGWQYDKTGTGSPLIKAMQTRLGVYADGLIGPTTINALQKRMGTVIDGELWEHSPCIKEMQRRLNKGTF